MKKFAPVLLAIFALAGCSTNESVNVRLLTDSKGRLVDAKLVDPSPDKQFNELAVELAKRFFPTKVPAPLPNHVYNQPVDVSYPLVRRADQSSDAIEEGLKDVKKKPGLPRYYTAPRSEYR
ncbi:energy transducer TonB [Rhizobium sp. S152]|uniref:energy transducer TonB family protein n=1 Tax=Rhizobium sp. S152 TaxID=3055038 RepID=UPI0025A97B19|nr:energy transducer TonB [Rhizobium sp. S152]MDM9625898.1 energy transducer TonB [Rhizobium sp. S152]